MELNKRIGLNPLYSSKSFLLQTIETLIAGDRVFVGNQPDDFGLCGVLTPANRVLLLGLGYGGAIRPLSLAASHLKLVALDNNPNTLQACKLLMAEYFPSLEQIHYLLGDASDFPAYTSLPFDAICVDLYTESGYPNFVFDHLFWHKVRSGLEPEGVAIVNAFGLPAHLHPLIGETPQVQVIRAMQAEFRTVYALPYRRNMTLVGTSNTKPWPRKLNAVVDLRGVDSIIADLLPIRWALAQPVRVRDLPTAPLLSGRTDINTEMERRWPELVNTLNTALLACGHKGVESGSLRAFFSDPVRAPAAIEWLLSQDAPEASFVPIAIATSAFTDRAGLEWYVPWVLENSERLMERDRAWFVNTALWQLLALAANPFAGFEHLAADVEVVARDLQLSELVFVR